MADSGSNQGTVLHQCVALSRAPPCIQLLNVTQCPAFRARNSVVGGKDQNQELAGFSTETGISKELASSTTSFVKRYKELACWTRTKLVLKAQAVPSDEILIGGAAETGYRLCQRLGFSCHVLRSKSHTKVLSGYKQGAWNFHG